MLPIKTFVYCKCTLCNLDKKLDQMLDKNVLKYFLLIHLHLDFQTDGNCCWEIRSLEQGNARKQLLDLGRIWKPTFQPKLFKKIKCNNHLE